MSKALAIGALGVGLLAIGSAAAQERGMRGGMMEHPGMSMMGVRSPEDMTALVDAYIAALHAGLKLSSQQEALWPPVEQALRSMAQIHLGHMAAMRQERGRAGGDPIRAIRTMADHMTQGAEAARRLADAAEPLHAVLDDGQKRRLRLLTRGMAFRGMMGGGGRGMMGRFGDDGDDRDDQ